MLCGGGSLTLDLTHQQTFDRRQEATVGTSADVREIRASVRVPWGSTV